MVIQRRYTYLAVLIATLLGNLATPLQVSAQDPSSFYFTSPQPKGVDNISSVPKNWHGVYRSEKDTTLRLYIKNDSIYTEAPLPVIASLYEAHQEGYRVLDSIMIKDNDTLPCWVHQDTVYFFIYVKKMIYTRSENQSLYPTAEGEYLLMNSKTEKGYWETALFTHQGSAVELAYFDHAANESKLQKKKKIKKEKTDNGWVYYASFKEKEWATMYCAEWFPYKTRYNKY